MKSILECLRVNTGLTIPQVDFYIKYCFNFCKRKDKVVPTLQSVSYSIIIWKDILHPHIN